MSLSKNDTLLTESDPRWLDIKTKNIKADSCFVYANTMEKIYCRPFHYVRREFLNFQLSFFDRRLL
ncbi:Ada metal-binding domain-containing protein [Xenorhabdus bovienii]|uniref:Ada metal-binding domain-containing protein n=1 Tax=Xenorhabdus bovienii TaxID=40576 RepID=UPI003DA333DB